MRSFRLQRAQAVPFLRGPDPSSPTTPASINASSNGNCSECTGGASPSRRSAAALARRLLEGRLRRVGLASLAQFFGVSTRPCHRALPDAEATAEILVHLIGLAQELELGAFPTCALAAPRKRRVYGKRSLARGAPRGRASTSFATATTRCSTSAAPATCAPGFAPTSARAPAAVGRGRAPCARSHRVAGARLGAKPRSRSQADPRAQPPANSRSRRKEHGVYLKPRGDDFVVTKTATARSDREPPQSVARRRALAMSTTEELETPDGGPLPRLRARLDDLAESLRYEEAARLRDRIEALDQVLSRACASLSGSASSSSA